MPTSTTIIAALKFEGGVVIGADSQASDLHAVVRWPIEKLDRIGNHPLVVGFSGSVGMGERARKALEAAALHANTFKKRDRVRDGLERCLDPVYKAIKEKNPAPSMAQIWQITLWGLGGFWAGDEPHIVEYEPNGDCCFHEFFHAIGSGSNTAYAIWRTLGGRELLRLDAAKSVAVTLRIIRTCVDVELWGVNEPLSAWMVTASGARKLLSDEIQAQMQYVDEWEKRERRAFLET